MELFKLFGTIAVNNSAAVNAVKDTTQVAENAQSKIGNAFEKVGKAAIKAGQVIATGLVAGTTAIVALTKSAIDSYADYEQLVGGVETLFGAGGQSLEDYAKSVGKTTDEVAEEYSNLIHAQEMVMKNADKAYQTAGMSANEYMETVTSLSASLIQSLEGNTVAAAEKADQAIVDMADNANKMGSTMESIQNAYQGFAKQNYTMLDNLKLGYGGTKEEMERLLADAQALSGIEYDISSYADVVDAIHVIQTEMGITGTTAKEASKTISGSVSAMRSAWKNLVTGLGNDQADLTALIDNFVASVVTVGDNLIPRIEIILNGIVQLISELVPKITAALPGMLNSILPTLVNGAVALVQGLVDAMPQIINALMGVLPALIDGILQISTAIIASLPMIIEAICNALPTLIPQLIIGIGTLIVAIAQALPKCIQPILNAIPAIGKSIMETFSSSISENEALQGIVDAISPVIETIGELAMTLGEGIFDVFSENIGGVQELFSTLIEVLRPLVETILANLVTGIQTLTTILSEVVFPVVSMLIGWFTDLATTIATNVQPAIESIAGKFGELYQAVQEAVVDYIIPFCQDFITMLQELWNENQDKINKIGELFRTVFDAIAGLVAWLVDIIKQYIIPFFTWLVECVQNNLGAIKDYFQSIFDYIGGIVDFFIALFKGDWEGMWEAIKATGQAALDIVVNAFYAAWSTICEVFSPITDFFSGIWDSIKETCATAWESITTMFGEVGVAISDAVTGAVKTAINTVLSGAIGIINGFIGAINGVIGVINEIPGVDLSTLATLDVPQLAKGGVLEKGQVGLLEGNGAEAVVPLDQNKKWISKVAEDMDGAVGNNDTLEKILAILTQLLETLPETLVESLVAGVQFKVNNREFARLVKVVN